MSRCVVILFFSDVFKRFGSLETNREALWFSVSSGLWTRPSCRLWASRWCPGTKTPTRAACWPGGRSAASSATIPPGYRWARLWYTHYRGHTDYRCVLWYTDYRCVLWYTDYRCVLSYRVYRYGVLWYTDYRYDVLWYTHYRYGVLWYTHYRYGVLIHRLQVWSTDTQTTGMGYWYTDYRYGALIHRLQV